MKKLAIVGTGSLTRDTAPWDDPSFDVWVFNEAANHPWCKRWSACLQLHPENIYTGTNTKDPHHWEWLQRKHHKPIYMQELDPRVPDSVRFPLEDAIALAGERYLAATIADSIALAILQGYEYVSFHGIELSASEYEYQAECIRFWVGFLKGRLGTENVNADCMKHLFQAPLYGYEGNFAFGSDYFAERAKFLDGEWDAANKNLKNLQKAIARAAEKNEHEKARELILKFQGTAIEAGELAGALSEAERYQTFGSRYADRGGFEYAAAKAQRDGEAIKPQVWVQTGQIEYVWNGWKQGNPHAAKQMLMLVEKMGTTAYDMGAQLGIYKENISYILKYDETVKAGGKVLLEGIPA